MPSTTFSGWETIIQMPSSAPADEPHEAARRLVGLVHQVDGELQALFGVSRTPGATERSLASRSKWNKLGQAEGGPLSPNRSPQRDQERPQLAVEIIEKLVPTGERP